MTQIAVVGLGYVGLPLAVEFGRRFATWGYDVDSLRVAECRSGTDVTGEVGRDALNAARRLRLTDDINECKDAKFFIVAVPTPVDGARRPDLRHLVRACETVAEVMQRGATVVFESTVYPGATQEVCLPVLERRSGLRYPDDFRLAYSPERVNPGDKQHDLDKIVKLVAADDPATRKQVADLYRTVVSAGVYEVDSIRIGEAAKVIENTQRDLNIALVNELAIIFDRLGLDTTKILEAAGTKWNFLPFRPGLVGGHCIGVDPYYLTYKAQMAGYHPEIILAGRRINDSMGKFVAEKTVKTMTAAGIEVTSAKINILGVTFKEDCPDLRNSQVVSIIEELKSYGTLELHVHDPLANQVQAAQEYGIRLSDWNDLPTADAVLVAVAHNHYRRMTAGELQAKLKQPGVLIDVKSIFEPQAFEGTEMSYWRL